MMGPCASSAVGLRSERTGTSMRPRGCSSVGRAPPWHGGSRAVRFRQLHVRRPWASCLAGSSPARAVSTSPIATSGASLPTAARTKADSSSLSRWRRGIVRCSSCFARSSSVGSLLDRPASSAPWQPLSTLTSTRVRSHRSAVIPFAERYLLPSRQAPNNSNRGATRWTSTGWHLRRRAAGAKARTRVPSMDAIARFGAGDSAGRTTTVPPAGDVAAFLGGFIAAEGTFVHCRNHFAFAVGLGANDARVVRDACRMVRRRQAPTFASSQAALRRRGDVPSGPIG